MRTLKLKKIKISKVGNPHLLLGGAANAGQAANGPHHPDTVPKDTKIDGDCKPHTNGGDEGRTGAVRNNRQGAQN